ncbi:hypothetical protein BP6252_04160 [Coleophoma cylindrospora]|uniref:F-box domain-containing protein n=1 Tax=Coleophoma cylindrospora TaxID=1849047 RepID=A0A3D8RZQ1_9HELO|nr:hypothetical protein BP6252_04160 [Coleophoma cylindrospora]
MSHHHGTECTCMLDGPDYPEPSAAELRFEMLLTENKRILDENQKLRDLLDEHGINYQANIAAKRRRTSTRLNRDLPLLPKELQLKILRHALTCQFPIIDPFYKPRLENLTVEEKRSRRKIPIHWLAVCKDFHAEGVPMFVTTNKFIFTQVAALQQFANIPREVRATIDFVTLRIVGRYYDNEARKQNLFGNQYHPGLRDYRLPILARPAGAEMDKGIHAYCYHQFGDFLKALQVSKEAPGCSRSIQKLFPGLKAMRIDLVNFTEYLWYPGRDFSSIIRWQTGPLVEELVITGVPEDDPEEGVETLIDRMVQNEGVFASGPPIFYSMTKNLRSLNPLGLAVRVVRAEKDVSKIDFKKAAAAHPTGGKPPPSFHRPGRTIWKYTQDSLSKPEKKWIEFDRKSGYPAEDVDDLMTDFDDEDDFFDSELGLDDDESEDADSDDSSTGFAGMPDLIS